MKGIAAYRTNRVASAPNEQIVVMLFETAIHRLERARAAMVSAHRGARIEWLGDLGHVRAIVIELSNALDADAAPELSRNLAMTYGWMLNRIGEVGKSGVAEEIDALLRVCTTLHDAFQHAASASDDEPIAEAG